MEKHYPDYLDDYAEGAPNWRLIDLLVICSVVMVLSAYCSLRDFKDQFIIKKLEAK